MAWITPKTDWTTADGVDFNDLNRIEGNVVALQTGTKEHVLLTTTGDTILARDGGNVLIRTTTDSGPRLVVADGVGSLPSISGDVVALFQSNSGSTTASAISILAGSGGISSLYFGDTDAISVGRIIYVHSDNSARHYTNSTEAMRLTSANHLLVNTTSDPGETVHIDGSLRVTGTSATWILAASGRTLQHSFDGANFLTASHANGSYGVVTGGRSASTVNANMLFNADQSVTVNTTLKVDTIEEKTAGTGVSVDGVSLKDGNLKPTKGVYVSGADNSTTPQTSNDWFVALEGSINTGDNLVCSGQLYDTGTSTLYNVSQIQKSSSTVLQLRTTDVLGNTSNQFFVSGVTTTSYKGAIAF